MDYLPQGRMEYLCSVCVRWHLGWSWKRMPNGVQTMTCKFCKTVYYDKEKYSEK